METKLPVEESFFTKLVQTNIKYLEHYYLHTQQQARKSFCLVSFVAIAGLCIITGGIVMMFSKYTVSAYVVTGVGILGEFIASVFFYLYNRTILKISEYHQKLLITQNISLALKITDEMKDGETKDKSLLILIERLTTDVNKYLSDPKD